MDYTYIVVGAGAAGCIVANRLSADPTVSVLVLEAGGTDLDKPHIQEPDFGYKHAFSSDYDWDFYTVPQQHAAQRRIYQPRGKVLGGSSAINSMLYVRGHRADYDRWAALGNVGWSYDEVLPYFKKSEYNERIHDEFHGVDGEWNICDRPRRNPLSEHFVAAAQKLGYEHNDDFNGAQQAGFGFYQVNQKHNKRHSVATAFLHPALQRSNVTAVTHAHVMRIIVENNRAVGVTYHQQDETVTVHVTGEVILCAGAVQSPQILMLSGIGDRNHLDEVGVDTIHHLPGVGANFHDHPDSHILYQATPTIEGHLRQEFPYQDWYSGGFIYTDDNEPSPDVQFHFLASRTFGEDMKQIGFAISPCLLRPKSKGTLRLQDNHPLSEPLLDPNYFANPDDMEAMIRGLRVAHDLGQHMTEVGTPVHAPADITNDAAVSAFIRQVAATAYHPVGSCKMGHDAQAVVDERLRVHGIAGLRVVDASIMPEIVSGNTHAPSIMIGEKGAAMIIEDYA